ncbi:Uncharacterised protein [Vibrio cholerae]|nr:Uncharacterised protein [Vibrio cholerae]
MWQLFHAWARSGLCVKNGDEPVSSLCYHRDLWSAYAEQASD